MDDGFDIPGHKPPLSSQSVEAPHGSAPNKPKGQGVAAGLNTFEEAVSNNKRGMPRQMLDAIRKQRLWKRVAWGRAFGEAASMASAPLAVAIVSNTSLDNPYSDLKGRIARTIVEPHLDEIDEALGHAKSIDVPAEREKRHKLSREEQALRVTDLLVDQFGLKFGASIAGQFATQDLLLRAFHAPVNKKDNAISVGVDRGVQIGSMILANTVCSEQALAAQNALTKVLKGVGVEDDKAQEWANYTVNFTLPNLAAAVASTALLIRSSCRK